MTTFEQFNKLHQQADPLLIANVWNAQSAKAFEKLKLQALATSSAAVAETLGYADGEGMSFDEYLFVVKRIKASTTLPLSVDLETGYGKITEEIVSNIKRLHEIGVVGINIEDTIVGQGSSRKISDAGTFAGKLKQISAALDAENIKVWINVRCDAFLLPLPDARKEAIERLQLYQETGVHGIFLPCITDLEDIRALVKAAKLPVNVMCMPGLPDFDTLRSAGVKRISMGNFLNKALYTNLEKMTERIIREKNFSSLFAG